MAKVENSPLGLDEHYLSMRFELSGLFILGIIICDQYKRLRTATLSFFLLFFMMTNAYAEVITVKYRSTPIETTKTKLTEFSLKPSSVVKRLLYDKEEQYLLVKLTGTFYHYCGIPERAVTDWLKADSLGKYYTSNIRGNYDCRVYPVPNY